VVELIPESYLSFLDPTEIFGRVAPLVVDLGCGDGSFLAAMARLNPAHDFLGIERLAGRVRTAARKASELPNVRVLRVETAYAVRYLLPPNSVQAFYLLFPDPWPKRRHHRRRIFTPDFVETIISSLAPAGVFQVATDQRDYFEEIRRVAKSFGALQKISWNGANGLPPTTFERRFVKAGADIYRLELRKVSPAT
jgi:tRNA (guanine-N7-)-methyltransferase